MLKYCTHQRTHSQVVVVLVHLYRAARDKSIAENWNHNHLPNNDLDTVVASGPGDLDVIALRNDLTTVDLTGDGGAREIAVGSGTGAGAGLPGSTTVSDNVNGTEILVSQVSRGPAGGISGSGGQRGEKLGLLGSRDAGALAFEVEDELAGVGLVLVAESECHKSGDVGTSIVGAAGNETAGSVEVNGASLAVVLRGEVGEDGCNGLGVWDNGWAAVS